jgi:hypothetical protein
MKQSKSIVKRIKIMSGKDVQKGLDDESLNNVLRSVDSIPDSLWQSVYWQMLIKKNKKNKDAFKKLIPHGCYCYSGSCRPGSKTFKICPFWSKREGKIDQESGYCAYLGKGDWDLNKTKTFRQEKNGKMVGKWRTANEIGIPGGLLWDQVKECGVNKEN